MLSVLIETLNDEDGLARTLASLVPGAVEGVVREVIVCDRGSSDHTGRVADHAGCIFLPTGGITAGMRLAKAEWLLIMEPGARLGQGWMEQMLAHGGGQGQAVRLTPKSGFASSFLSRLFPSRRPLASGLLVTRRQALPVANGVTSADEFARKIKARRLGATILPASARA